MPGPNFYNENRNRAFPFLRGTVGIDVPQATPITGLQQLPDDWIVDAGFYTSQLFGFDENYNQVEHHFYLNRVWRSGNVVYFEFAAGAPELYYLRLVFSRHVDDAPYVVEHLDSNETLIGSQSESGEELPCSMPAMGGYLVTGDLSAAATLLTEGVPVGRATTAEAIVEPALVQCTYRWQLTGIALANEDRTRATAPAGCPELTWPHETGIPFVQTNCLQGHIYWKPGFNCRITQDDTANSLTIEAVVAAGEGEPCEEVPLFAGESPPNGSDNSLLAGGAVCNETLRSVNGVGGPFLTLFAGEGVAIIEEPQAHKITVDVNMIGLAVCYADFSQISESV